MMSLQSQPVAGASSKPALPVGLLIATILVIAQVVVRTGFLISGLVFNARFLSNPAFLIQSFIIPVILVILTVVMIALILARVPAAKPYGIAVCILNLLFQIYVVGRFLDIYRTGIGISPIFVLTTVGYVTVFTLALIFLARWAVGPQPMVAPEPTAALTGKSYKGMATASLVCAICGPLFLIILGPVALGLGIAARNGMRVSKNFEGQGMALAGIIIGSIEVVILVLLLLLAIAMRS